MSMNFFKNKAEREADARNARVMRMKAEGVLIPQVSLTMARIDGEYIVPSTGTTQELIALVAGACKHDSNLAGILLHGLMQAGLVTHKPDENGN